MENLESRQNNFNRRAREMKCLCAVAAVSFVVAFPVLYAGFPVDGHDSPSQFNLYAAFSRQIWMGEAYPRWLIDMNGGFGSPVFFFYPPAAFYATTFFSLILGQPETDGMIWRQLGLSAGLAVIGSGVACYLWLKETVNPAAAAIASVIYLIVPYHLSADLFTRGALAEVWSFFWIPSALKFVKVIDEKPAFGLIGLALSYSLLIMTHLPTALIFSPVLACYGLFLERGKRRRIQSRLTVLGMGIGIGIASVYLLPALAARSYVAMDSNPTSLLFYDKYFLFSFYPKGNAPFVSYLTILLLSMIAGTAISAFAERNLRLLNREQIFWLAVAVLSIFMMTPFSRPVWQLFPLIQAIQFPFRFNTLLCVAYTGLLAAALSKISFSEQYFAGGWQKSLFIYGTAVLCCFWIGIFIDAIVTEKPSEYKDYVAKMYSRKLEFAEHMPKTARLEKLDFLIEERRESGSPYLLKAADDQARVEVVQWNPRDIDLKISKAKQTNLIAGQFYYPGWKAVFYPDSETTPIDLPVKPSEDGLLSIEIPETSGRIKLSLTNEIERPAMILSLTSIAVLGLIGFGLKKRLET